MNLDDIGESFNINREKIRQIEEKAMRKLRHPSRKMDVFYSYPRKQKEKPEQNCIVLKMADFKKTNDESQE